MSKWQHKIWLKIVARSLIVTTLYLTSDIWRLPVLSGSVAYAQTPSKSIHNQGKEIESTLKKIEASTSNPETLLQEVSSQIDLLKAGDTEFNLNLKKTQSKITTLSPQIQARHDEFVQNYERQITELLTELDIIPLIQDQGLLSEKIKSSLTKLKEFTKKKTKILHTDTLSHRSLSDTVVSPGVLTTPILPPGITNTTPQPEDLTETPETEITPEIKRYAEELSNPVQIYEFVRNSIGYEPYFGAVKTATQVLLDRKGNDIDTASLLIALLRASKIPARYVYGKADIPIDRAASWVGTTDPTLTVGNFTKNGIPAQALTGGGTYSQVTIDHVWVRAYIDYIPLRGRDSGQGDTWIDIDPSFKGHIWKEGKDVGIEIGVDPITFLSDIKRQSQINETESYATGEPQDYIIQKVQDWGKDVENYASANTLTLNTLYRTKEVKAQEFGILPATLPWTSRSEQAYSSLPDELKHHLKLTLLSTDGVTPVIQHKISLPELGTKRVTLSYAPETQDDTDALNLYVTESIIPCYLIRLLPELRVDGELISRLTDSPITMGWNQELQLEFITPTTGTDKVINDVTAGSYTGISLNPITISDSSLYTRLANLRFIQERISKGDVTLTRDDLIGEVLHTVGLSYFYQLDRLNQATQGALNVNATRQPSEVSTTYDLSVTTLFGVPFEASASLITLDVDRDIITPISTTGDAVKEKQFLASTGLTASALEHAILEEVLSGDAVSTVRAIESANASNIPVYKVTSANLESVISNLSTDVRDIAEQDLRNATNAGRIVTIPKDLVNYAGWTGIGYIILDTDTNAASYLISGGIGGGIRPSTFLTPASLIIKSAPSTYTQFTQPGISWLNVAEDWTEDISWAYVPAITSINEWFKDARTLDLATTIASAIAISGPISKVSSSITIFDAFASPSLFSPNNDGVLDTTNITASLTKSCNWALTISPLPLVGEGGGEGAIVTWTGTGSSISIVWDGKDSFGALVPDGTYTYTITASDPVKGIIAEPVSGKVTIDTIAPLAELTAPQEGLTLTGVVFIEGSCSDEHFASYKLQYDSTLITSGTSPISGTIYTWDTSKIQSGTYILKFTVKDTAGNTTTVIRNITLSNDTQSPQVTITTPQSGAVVLGTVHISSTATDDVAVTKMELFISPPVMPVPVIASTSEAISYSWDTTTIPNGTYTLTVKAYDIAGNIGTVQVAVTVSNAISNLQASPNPFSPNADGYQDTTTISAVLASSMAWSLVLRDMQNTEQRTFSGSGTEISQVWDGKNPQGSVVPDGTYIATITADTATAIINLYVQVVNIPPTASITTPTANQQVSGFVDIIGTASDVVPLDFSSWTLTYEPFEGNAVQIATGASPISEGTLATWDTTQLQNGVYTITLTTQDKSGQTATASVQVQLIGELKVGNFSFTQQDIVIPVQGLPITVSRTYDTLNKDHSKDLGYGWTLDISDMDVQENQHKEEFESISGGYLPLRVGGGRDVTITLPDGRVTVFGFELKPTTEPFTYKAVWTGPPGVYDTLTMNGDNRVYALFGGIVYWAQGTQDQGLEYYEVPSFTLTTQDGTKYLIEKPDLGGDYVDIGTGEFIWSQNLGTPKLTRITDTNNNSLTFRPEGVTHSTGKGITFNRDGQGRITSIIDPSGDVAVEYGYDVAGDLTTVTQLVDKTTTPPNKVTTTFTYDSHRLKDIQDPRGPGYKPVRNYYDTDGRLWKTVDGFDREVVFTHNIGTRQDVVTNRLGHPTVYEYNNDGLVVSVTDALGNTTTYEYDTNKNKIAETDTLGNTRRFTYNSQGKVTNRTDPLGNTTYYEYNQFGKPTKVTDPLGHMTSFTYDDRNNRTSTTDALGNTTTFAFDTTGKPTSVTDPHGRKTLFEHDTYGQITNHTDPLGTSATYTYDPNGNQLTQALTYTTPSGPKSTTLNYTYDSMNRAIAVSDPEGVIAYEYDPVGKIVASVDKMGNRTEAIYDVLGQLTGLKFPDGSTESSTYDAEGRRIGFTDKSGNTTTYTYDILGRLIKTTLSDGSSTTNTYDAVGRVISTADANSNTTSFEYDASGRRTAVIDALGNRTTFVYDVAGNVISQTDASGNTTRFAYNAKNQKVRTVYPDGTQETITYDSHGQRIAQSNQAQIETRFEYDAMGKLIKVIQPEPLLGAGNPLTNFTYDGMDNKTSQADALGRTIGLSYDDMGRLRNRTLPGGQFELFSYNVNGNILSHTDFNGNTTVFEYDALNRMTKAIFPDSTTRSITYAPGGQRTSVTDATGTTTYEYDIRGRLSKINNPDGTFISYTYDAVGNQKTVSTPQATISHEYDTLNRLVGVTDTTDRTTYTYDGVGNHTGVTYSNGTQTEYTYDGLNRLTNIVNKRSDGSVISSYAYTLDSTGKRTKVVENSGRTVEYTYDNLSRLIKEKITDTAQGNKEISYTYDLVGNRIKKMMDGIETTYGYNTNDCLLTEVAPEGTITYGYDNNGNQISITNPVAGISTFGYDFENRLKQVTTPQGTTSYTYDSDGNRVQKVAGTSAINFLVDTNNITRFPQVMQEHDAQGIPQVFYTYGADLITQKRGSNVSFYHYDGTNSTRSLTDSTGTVTDTYNYLAFGEQLNRTGTTTNNYLFQGEQFDNETGNYYLRARYLDPGQGRFLTMDPFEGFSSDPASLHKYTFVANNPVNRTDPSGMFTLSETTMASGIISTLASMYNRVSLTIMAGMLHEAAVAGSTIPRIDAQQKNNDKATIMIHGIAKPPDQYSGEFQQGLMDNNIKDHDFYEFVWTGFQIPFNRIPSKPQHIIAVISFREALLLLYLKGYTETNIVSHSWGTVISADTMRGTWGIPVKNWFTMGSPLRTDTPKYDVYRWTNIYSWRDPVIHYGVSSGDGEFSLWGAIFFNSQYPGLTANESVDVRKRVDFPNNDLPTIINFGEHTAYWGDRIEVQPFVAEILKW